MQTHLRAIVNKTRKIVVKCQVLVSVCAYAKFCKSQDILTGKDNVFE